MNAGACQSPASGETFGAGKHRCAVASLETRDEMFECRVSLALAPHVIAQHCCGSASSPWARNGGDRPREQALPPKQEDDGQERQRDHRPQKTE